MICCFSAKTSFTSSPLNRSSLTMILAKTFSASPSVKPSAACNSRSRPASSRSIFTCWNCFTSAMILSSSALKSSRDGSG